VLGWTADRSTGAIDDTTPISASSSICLPIGRLAVSRQTTNITFGGNLDARRVAGDKYSPGAKVYDSLGVAHPLNITFTKTDPVGSQGYADTAVATLGTGNLVLTPANGAARTVTLDGTNNTLQGVCDAINGLGSNFTATIVKDAAGANPYRLIVADKTGAAVTVDSSGLAAGGGTVPTFGVTADSQWTWTATSVDAKTPTVGTGNIIFDTKGFTAASTGSITLDLANPNGASNPINMALSFMPITQKAGIDDVRNTGDDGLPLGMLNEFTIGKDGIITGAFTNGMTQPLGRVALAQFSNPAGLSKAGNNLLVETSNAGVAEVGHAGVGSMGSLSAGFLESSNVDLPTEFANMIVAQRGFQANSRIITTSDEILQDIVQLKR
jgi:flagellar hook protein FlgE